MLVLGLTGSIGSGKSTVAELLARSGVPVLSSDAIAQQIIEHDPEVRAALAGAFGPAVVPPEGPINRAALATAIFGPTPEHEQRRRFVERLVHPRVIELVASELDRLAARGEQLAVVESALIYRAGIEDLFDYVIAVVAPEAIRRERLRHRGMLDADITHRQAIQDSDEELRQRADFVLDNSGTLDELNTATQTLLGVLRALPPRPVDASA
ncbi:MAG: dephospho-CoA kinase [Candidatus Kapaibacterium sp.]|nr:MAG: dephospho-CoA kinase [Candidatus Kapabacteria bacterium]